MTKLIETSVPSTDGVHDLYCRLFLPEGTPKALFHIVHGMTEYINRYDELMGFLAENGYIAFGFDNLGHGRTARSDDELGFIAHRGGWKLLVDDVDRCARTIKKEYGPGLPYILMGHSMGSFIARLAAARFGGYEKLIICGTGGPTPAFNPALAACKTVKAMKGERHHSDLLENLAFGSYNKRFPDKKSNDWLTKNEAVRLSYRGDKYCNFRFTVSAMEDLVHLNKECNRKSWPSQLSKTAPVFLIAGAEDPVGDYGEGIKKVNKMLVDAGVPVTMKLYPGLRHEIHNDDFETVSRDILAFISH